MDEAREALKTIAAGGPFPCMDCGHVHDYRAEPNDRRVKMMTWRFCPECSEEHVFRQMSVYRFAQIHLVHAPDGDSAP